MVRKLYPLFVRIRDINERVSPEHKKAIIAATLLLVVIAGGVFGWQRWREKTLEERLETIDTHIRETERQIEELEALTPEARARREEEQRILGARKVTDDVLVEGVAVMTQGGKKIIRNRTQGYVIEVPVNLLIARSVASDAIELHDKELMCEGDPLCNPVIRIVVTENNPNELSLEEWFEAEERKAGAPVYSPREKTMIGPEKTFRVKESIPPRFDGFYYYLARGKKIYSMRISGFDDPRYRSHLESFRFE